MKFSAKLWNVVASLEVVLLAIYFLVFIIIQVFVPHNSWVQAVIMTFLVLLTRVAFKFGEAKDDTQVVDKRE